MPVGTASGTAELAAEFKALTCGKPLATPEKDGHILRYIGPSSYGAGTNPYPSFHAYLKWLCDNEITAKISNNNAFNTMENPAKVPATNPALDTFSRWM